MLLIPCSQRPHICPRPRSHYHVIHAASFIHSPIFSLLALCSSLSLTLIHSLFLHSLFLHSALFAPHSTLSLPTTRLHLPTPRLHLPDTQPRLLSLLNHHVIPLLFPLLLPPRWRTLSSSCNPLKNGVIWCEIRLQYRNYF